jgi:hypothetical protein
MTATQAAGASRQRGALKPVQWVLALGALVVMVFAVTFALNYLGTGGPSEKDGGPAALPRLNFPEPVFPPTQTADGRAVPELTQEAVLEGHHDFWFRNDTEQPMKVGASYKGCTCQSIELILAPDGWQDQANETGLRLASLVGLGAAGPLGALETSRLADADRERRKLESSLRGTTLDPDDPNVSVEVPAGKAGWVRMHWKDRKAESAPTALRARLWCGTRAAELELAVRAHFYDTLAVLPDHTNVVLRPLGPAQEFMFQGDVLCYSPTRANLKLKARLVVPTVFENDPTADPVAVGDPQRESVFPPGSFLPTTPTPTPVVSTYRVPVMVRKPGGDSKHRIDYGPFRRVVLVEDEETATTVQATVSGAVENPDLKVGAENEDGVLRFGEFDRSLGKTRSIELRTQEGNLQLAVDKRTSDFLEATLSPKSTKPVDGWYTWELTVTVRKNSEARGRFPAASPPGLRDCAVYLRPENAEQGVWCHRIPTTGEAQSH